MWHHFSFQKYKLLMLDHRTTTLADYRRDNIRRQGQMQSYTVPDQMCEWPYQQLKDVPSLHEIRQNVGLGKSLHEWIRLFRSCPYLENDGSSGLAGENADFA